MNDAHEVMAEKNAPMSDPVIHVVGLSKRYRIGARQRAAYQTLRDHIAGAFANPFRRLKRGTLSRSRARKKAGPPRTRGNKKDATWSDSIWALKNIAFEVRPGEVVGIIGGNGAGKSTLLKVLSRITEPTTGYADIRGRVGSLLEVGTGFHPELTGRENIFLNGAILGMKRTEIQAKFDEIVAFAEVKKFIDTPVKFYSSGMYLRLAFGVAAHLEQEILLVDEVLAVGDGLFQKKCLGRMEQVAEHGRTVLFVSHNMSAIARLCQRALWIDDGRIKLDGPADSVVGAYVSSGTSCQATWVNPKVNGPRGPARILSARLVPSGGETAGLIDFDVSFLIEVEYEVQESSRHYSVLLRLVDAHGNPLWTTCDIDTTSWRGRERTPGKYRSVCEIPGALLKPGSYFLTIAGHIPNIRPVSFHENVLAFEISETSYPFDRGRVGMLAPRLKWKIEKMENFDREDPAGS